MIGRRAGLSWDQLGLATSRLRRGILLGLGAALVPVVVAAIAIAVPVTREVIAAMHAPTGPGATDLANDVGLRMFVGVALVEEMLLRSGLFGAMRHRRPTRRSGCPPWPSVHGTSSPHSRGTATRVRFTTMVRMIGPVAALGLTVGATTLAGSAFAWLRLRSGHVVTTVLVHAAINGTVRPGRPRCVPVTGAPEARPCRRRHATAPTARARR